MPKVQWFRVGSVAEAVPVDGVLLKDTPRGWVAEFADGKNNFTIELRDSPVWLSDVGLRNSDGDICPCTYSLIMYDPEGKLVYIPLKTVTVLG